MALNATIPARILRVNHGGEHGAIAIYSAQIAVARFRASDLLPFLRECLANERSHRERFRALMPARQAKPCRAMWIWVVGGGFLGGVTALAGREAILACTEAVEQTVHRHLVEQIRWARGRDDELGEAIAAVQIEEDEHLRFAVTARRGRGFSWLSRLIEVVTEGLIFVSTRGDSARLARELAALPEASH